MRLSFSTRGWAHLGWETYLDAAEKMNFEGIEVYNLPKFPEFVDRSGPFHKYNMASTARQLSYEIISQVILQHKSEFLGCQWQKRQATLL